MLILRSQSSRPGTECENMCLSGDLLLGYLPAPRIPRRTKADTLRNCIFLFVQAIVNDQCSNSFIYILQQKAGSCYD